MCKDAAFLIKKYIHAPNGSSKLLLRNKCWNSRVMVVTYFTSITALLFGHLSDIIFAKLWLNVCIFIAESGGGVLWLGLTFSVLHCNNHTLVLQTVSLFQDSLVTAKHLWLKKMLTTHICSFLCLWSACVLLTRAVKLMHLLKN